MRSIAPAGRGSGNSRNGHTSKTVLTEDGELELSIPRDRAGTFEPRLVPKGVTRLDGFESIESLIKYRLLRITSNTGNATPSVR